MDNRDKQAVVEGVQTSGKADISDRLATFLVRHQTMETILLESALKERGFGTELDAVRNHLATSHEIGRLGEPGATIMTLNGLGADAYAHLMDACLLSGKGYGFLDAYLTTYKGHGFRREVETEFIRQTQ